MASISTDELRNLAASAVGKYLDGEGSLTDMVVKVASGKSLTAEQVKRVCEMVYHDAYEKHFKSASSPDKYVSFDPPESALAIQRLRATQVTSKTASSPTPFSRHSQMDKIASAPMHAGKYQPLNAFDGLVKNAKAPDVNWENPLGDVYRIRQNIVEAVKELEGRYASLNSNEKNAMFELFAHAADAAKSGYGISGILHAMVEGASVEDLPPKIASQTLDDVTLHLGKKGFRLDFDKTAMTAEVNPEHPLPRAFTKVATIRRDLSVLTAALADVRADIKELDQRVANGLH